MALLTRILLVLLLLFVFQAAKGTASIQHRSEEYQGITNHRISLPNWSREKISHSRHDHRQALHETGTWSSWSHEKPTERSTLFGTTRSSLQSRSVRARHVDHVPGGQRATVTTSASAADGTSGTVKSEKFSAVAITEYGGTRAVAYTGYIGAHRHQQRQLAAHSHQRVPATSATYTRHHPGRRVCTRQVSNPSAHHRGGQFRFSYTTDLLPTFSCCPGWTPVPHLSFGCNQPICLAPCINGGVCTSPGKCTCPKGFTGSQCQTDVDECVTEKPCGQHCRNLPGSYECYCRPGFHLQPDSQSCRKNDSDDTAFEARDLENDFHEATSTTRRPTLATHDTENEVGDADLDKEYEIILRRLTKLEKQVARGRRRETENSDMSAKITSAVENINEMKRTIDNVQSMQREIYNMRSEIKQYEAEARNLHHLTDRVVELENKLRIRCRSTLPCNSGTLNY